MKYSLYQITIIAVSNKYFASYIATHLSSFDFHKIPVTYATLENHIHSAMLLQLTI